MIQMIDIENDWINDNLNGNHFRLTNNPLLCMYDHLDNNYNNHHNEIDHLHQEP